MRHGIHIRIRRISVATMLFLAIGWGEALPQSLQFYREVITVEVAGTHCWLSGAYHFRNRTASPITVPLYYPLFDHAELPFPDSITVEKIGHGSAIPFVRRGTGIDFRITIPAQDSAAYRVCYRQPTPENRMEYILRSTRQWRRPLEKAQFRIILPDTLRLTSVSLPMTRLRKDARRTVYGCLRRNFMPDENLIITWKRRKS